MEEKIGREENLQKKNKENKPGNAALASFFSAKRCLLGSRVPGEHGVKVPLSKQHEVWVCLLF